MFLDFDGTLSEIVARPELARPVPGAVEALAAVARTVDVVAVVSGRPTSQLRTLLPVPGVRLVGLYGLEESPAAVAGVRAALGDVQQAAGLVPGAWVEDKGASLTVHYRAAADAAGAEATLLPVMNEVASRFGLSLFEAKRALEVAAGPVPGKGAVIERLSIEAALAACLYAGDDLPDLDAFATLSSLAAEGLVAIKVAVRGDETPPAVLDAADVAVEGPAGLVAWLAELVRPPGDRRAGR